MKKILMFCLILGFQKTIKAQCDIAQKLVSISPSSISVGQSAEIKFSIGNAGSGTCTYNVGAIRVILSIPSKGFAYQEISSPVSGQGEYFTWTYNATNNVVVGINHTAIPSGAFESDVAIRVVGTTSTTAASNLNINILDGSSNKLTSNDPSSNKLVVSLSPLPVRLISFVGKSTTKGNELTWKVSSEQNFSHYEVEKSNNAKNFSQIGKVTGTGNSKENLSYSFLDVLNNSGMIPGANAISQTNDLAYFRLKMVDVDGKSAFSKVIFIENEIGKSTVGEFYPNPVIGNEISIIINSNENNEWSITSTDYVGRVIYTETRRLQIGENKLKLKLNELHSGVSIFNFENVEGSFQRKLMREN
jgi:hypothetical protein